MSTLVLLDQAVLAVLGVLAVARALVVVVEQNATVRLFVGGAAVAGLVSTEQRVDRLGRRGLRLVHLLVLDRARVTELRGRAARRG